MTGWQFWKSMVPEMNPGPASGIPVTLLRPTCVVCGETADISSLSTGNASLPVCRDTSCRMIVDKQKTLPPESFKHYLALHAGQIRSRREAQKQQDLLKQAKAEAEAGEEQLWWAHLHTLDEVQPFENLLQLKIPNGPRQSMPASAERRQIHATHVQSIIREGFSDLTLIPPPPEQPGSVETPQPMAGQLCAMCGGGCCTVGGDTAFLSVETIRRVISSQPEIEEQTLLDQYLTSVPAESMTGSCIYQTAKGCALPRELRSDICNNYLCQSLTALIERPTLIDGRQSPVLVLQRRQDHWRQETPGLNNEIIGAALFTEEKILPLEPLPNSGVQQNR